MNREIGRDLNAFSGLQKTTKQDLSTSQSRCDALKDENFDSEKMNESLAYLESVGRSQLNMSKPSAITELAMKKYINDPNYVEAHIAFCDSLVQKGYSLEEADRITEKVFSDLAQKDLYE